MKTEIIKRCHFNVVVVVTSLLALSGLTACSVSPTGRNQILLHSESSMAQMGAQSFEQLKQQQQQSKDQQAINYVRCVADAVVKQLPAEFKQQNWEVILFDSPQVNAFALPGGKIGVYTGLLNVAVNQHQLAAVVGHEVAHVIAQHGNERVSRAQMTETGMSVIGAVTEGTEYSDATMAALGLGVQYGVMMPYGRQQESEADVMGLELMAKAGFDPTQSIALWKNMAKAGGAQPPELLSTHPSHDTRISDLEQGMNQAKQLYSQAISSGNKAACQ